MHSGKVGRHPSGTGGVDAAAVSQAGSNALSRLPGPSTTTCSHSRRVFTRSDRNEPPHQAPCPCTLYACDGSRDVGASGPTGVRAVWGSVGRVGDRGVGASGPRGGRREPKLRRTLVAGRRIARAYGRAGALARQRSGDRGLGAPGLREETRLRTTRREECVRDMGRGQSCGRRANGGRAIGAQGLWGVGCRQDCVRRAERSV